MPRAEGRLERPGALLALTADEVHTALRLGCLLPILDTSMRTLVLTAMFLASGGIAGAQPVLDFARTDFKSVTQPRAIAVADFDRDGLPDFAQAGTGGGSVGIWLNRLHTTGGFERSRTIAVGGGPFEMAAGDLNRDGWTDLVIANAALEG